MKNFFSLIIALFTSLAIYAGEVTEQQALQKAQQFMKGKQFKQKNLRRAASTSFNNAYYVFNAEDNGGYVVVSGEDRLPDILMFAESGTYNEKEIPCNMKAWLEDYARQVSYLRTHPEAKSSRRARANKANIGNLLDCWFSQGNPYNKQCPEVDGERCVTGCVATAMAQIMYYYKWPNQTLETIPAYTTFILNISMPEIPVTTIDWANILKGYNDGDTYNTTQADAVATLMKLCGSSIEMDYTPTGSGAQTNNVRIAFKKYFGYGDMIEKKYRSDFSIDEWEQLVYDELNAKRPVLYSGISETRGGHVFVLDGYKDGFFHVNWGWGGSESYIMMTGEGDWKGFTIFQSAIINIQPDNGEYVSRYAVVEGEKMTVYYDNKRSQRSGTILPHKEDWQNYKDIITEIVIDPSFAQLNLRSLEGFFDGMGKLQKIEGIENLNTKNVTDMSNMFRGCNSLTSLDVSGFNTDNVKDMDYMFQNCSSLTSLDVSKFNTSNVTYMSGMFGGCSNLTTIYAGERWDMSKVEATDDMFYNCEKLIGGAGTAFTWDFINGEYARIDKGATNPGYFTFKKSTLYSIIYKIDGEVYKMVDWESGSTVTAETNPTKEGYSFSGWSDIPTTMPANNVVVEGSFSINSYTITYMIDDAVFDTQTVEYAATITPPTAPIHDGYTFEWLDVPATMPASDITIIGSYTSGIGFVRSDEQGVKWYTLEGKPTDTPRKGFNIKRTADGKTKKVVIR